MTSKSPIIHFTDTCGWVTNAKMIYIHQTESAVTLQTKHIEGLVQIKHLNSGLMYFFVIMNQDKWNNSVQITACYRISDKPLTSKQWRPSYKRTHITGSILVEKWTEWCRIMDCQRGRNPWSRSSIIDYRFSKVYMSVHDLNNGASTPYAALPRALPQPLYLGHTTIPSPPYARDRFRKAGSGGQNTYCYYIQCVRNVIIQWGKYVI